MAAGRLCIALAVCVVSACQTPSTPPPTTAPATATAPAPPRPAATTAPAPPTAAAPTANQPTVRPSPSAQSPVAVDAPRVGVLAGADQALARGDVAAADELYRRVLGTPPGANESRAVQDGLEQYARYRDVLALLLLGREDQARAQLQQLQQHLPDAPFTRLAAQLWDQYGMTSDVRAACGGVQGQVDQVRPVLDLLATAGLSVDSTTLCRGGSR